MDPRANEPAAAAPVATAVAVFTWIECVLCGARFCSHTRSGWEQSLDIPECGRCSEILKNDKAWGGCAVPTPGQLADDEGELKQEAWAQPGLLPLELSLQPEEGTPKKGSAQLHGTGIKKRKTSGPYADPSDYKKIATPVPTTPDIWMGIAHAHRVMCETFGVNELKADMVYKYIIPHFRTFYPVRDLPYQLTGNPDDKMYGSSDGKINTYHFNFKDVFVHTGAIEAYINKGYTRGPYWCLKEFVDNPEVGPKGVLSREQEASIKAQFNAVVVARRKPK